MNAPSGGKERNITLTQKVKGHDIHANHIYDYQRHFIVEATT